MQHRIRQISLWRWLALLPGALVFSAVAMANDFVSSWGPTVGSAMPVLEAPDQTGTERRLADLSGDQGLLLFLNRSADW